MGDDGSKHEKSVRGTDGMVGFVYARGGNDQAEKGEQEIKNITEGERIDVEVRFIKPFEGIVNAPNNNKILVCKSNESEMGNEGQKCISYEFYEFIYGWYAGKRSGNKPYNSKRDT
jgi:hypothetical protein